MKKASLYKQTLEKRQKNTKENKRYFIVVYANGISVTFNEIILFMR
jgi:hypothetical protein